MWALPEGVRCVSLGSEDGEVGVLGVDFSGKQAVEEIICIFRGLRGWLYFAVARSGDSIG